jgi:hypothetical protein
MKKTKPYIIILIAIIGIACLFVINYYRSFVKESLENQKSFHVLLATIGKDGIFRILRSFKTQLSENDYLTIVFDGPEWPNIQKVIDYTKDFKCHVSVIVEEENLGHWGHGIRNKHKDLKGDYVFHVDDDDDITPDCMESLRNHCNDLNKVFLFKMQLDSKQIIWTEKKIEHSKVGTPMGILPIEINKKSDFGYFYGGDFEFYKNLENQGVPFEYVDKLIYIVKPNE